LYEIWSLEEETSTTAPALSVGAEDAGGGEGGEGGEPGGYVN
jgi:hypothetical protein